MDVPDRSPTLQEAKPKTASNGQKAKVLQFPSRKAVNRSGDRTKVTSLKMAA